MTTYTSLLSGDHYIAEDWTVTIREKHADDLPGLSKLREMIRSRLSSGDSHNIAELKASYQHLLNSVNLTGSMFDRADRQLLYNVLTVFREEMRR